jgi:hypothetical protein
LLLSAGFLAAPAETGRHLSTRKQIQENNQENKNENKNENGAKVTREARGGIVMSMLKIAAVLSLAGVFGVVVSVILGGTPALDVLDAAFVCLALAGGIMILHVLIGLWTDFAKSA